MTLTCKHVQICDILHTILCPYVRHINRLVCVRHNSEAPSSTSPALIVVIIVYCYSTDIYQSYHLLTLCLVLLFFVV